MPSSNQVAPPALVRQTKTPEALIFATKMSSLPDTLTSGSEVPKTIVPR